MYVVETLGDISSAPNCLLKVIEIPDGVSVTLKRDIEGPEWVEEVHRIWT